MEWSTAETMEYVYARLFTMGFVAGIITSFLMARSTLRSYYNQIQQLVQLTHRLMQQIAKSNALDAQLLEEFKKDENGDNTRAGI